jgi:TetR/AcrR family transcriptional repressor of nem operon
MLAADFETLPRPMRTGVVEFFNTNEAWLTKVLQEGRRARTLTFVDSPSSVAAFLVSALEGAMLVARSYGKVARFESVVGKLLNDLTAARGA